MNFFNNISICRYGNIQWITYCCRDVFKSNKVIANKYDKGVYNNNSNYLAFSPIKLCRRSHQTTLKQPYIQVRFKNNCPRLHRDIEFPNFDAYRKEQFKDVNKTKFGSGHEKQGYTYVVGFFGLLCGMYCAKSEMVRFVLYMAAAADVRASASAEIDISKIAPGACLSYKWRGKPLFIKNRTQADIAAEEKTPLSLLRDPQTPEQRTIKPEWLIVIGICTHLGCVPVPNSGDWPGGFYCPCHGSHYDNVGRTRKGPAPTNLEVPPYKFLTDSVVMVG